jgi:hypothetical protein
MFLGTDPMQQIHTRFGGLRLLVDLNWDRVLWPAAICAALMLGNFAATL